MASASHASQPELDPKLWKQDVAPFQKANWRESIWQCATSILPFFVLWYLMYRSLEVSYLITLLLAFPAAGFTMRMFIIFHDAGHGSFFPSRKWNDFIGIFTGIFLMTPYWAWRHSHAIHHATAGDLDRRGTGDIWTLTKEEYYKMPKWKRFTYWLYRNPFVIFVIGPTLDFVVLQRFYPMNAATDPREKRSVIFTNIMLLVIIVGLSLIIGFKAFVLVELPIIAIASSAGVWLFYWQHQFEDVYWERHDQWDFAEAGLHGSSYYKMPRIFQWFSGNIGFHHIHHLSPRVPNYELEECYNNSELFQSVEPMTFWKSIRSLHIRLWDEDHHKMVGYVHEEEADEDTDLPPVRPTTGLAES